MTNQSTHCARQLPGVTLVPSMPVLPSNRRVRKDLIQCNSRNRLVLVLALGLIVSHRTNAQTATPAAGRSAVTLGYFGETFIHPGLFVGYERNLRPGKRYELNLSIKTGGYAHPHNQTGLFSELQLGQRYTFRSGMFIEQLVGVGYLHTFLNGGKVYEVSDQGVVSEASNTGRGHFMPSVDLGIGFNVAPPQDSPLLLFLRPKAFLQYPYNGYALPHAALLVGLTKVFR